MMDGADSYKRMSGNGREKMTGSLLFLCVSAIARLQ